MSNPWCEMVRSTSLSWAHGADAVNFTYGVVSLVMGCVMLVCLGVAARRRGSSVNAYGGGASLQLILPIYFNIVGAFTLEYLVQGIVEIAADIGDNDGLNGAPNLDAAPSAVFGFSYAAYRFVLDGVAVLLMQPSFGTRALKRAAALSGLWSVLIWVAFAVSWHAGHIHSFFMTLNVALLLFYGALIAVPAKRLYRRPGVRVYAAFAVVIHVLYSAGDAAYFAGDEAGLCVNVGAQLLLLTLSPLILYRTLAVDSQYWQDGWVTEVAARRGGGGGSGASASPYDLRREPSGLPISSPLLSVSLSHAAARELAVQLDGQRSVPVLNHACVSLRLNRVLGAGGTSRVYEGRWKGRPVALKVCYCVEITPERIEQIVAEGAALGGIRHENVIEVFGIAVAPPAVCLVMELAVRSLRAMLNDAAAYAALTWRDKLRICVECCQGLACLHSQRPPIRHNDLKALNFLLSASGTVKIADLGLALPGGSGVGGRSGGEPRAMDAALVDVTGRGCNWLAPEVASAALGSADAAGSTAADVYSLGVVFWEVLTGEAPFEHVSRPQLEAWSRARGVPLPVWLSADPPLATAVRAAVGVLGVTPPMPGPEAAPEGMRALLARMWALQPGLRPTAAGVLADLRAMKSA